MRLARRDTAVRWIKLNAVGGVGIGVQPAVLLVRNSGFHMSYLPATAFAVEMAVLP
jgi:putative flippase GtrA